MKRVLLIILFVVCTSNYSFGHPEDVGGWNKARWGMTKNEVLKVFEGKATVVEKPRKFQENAYTLIEIDEIEIGIGKYTVDFIFDGNEKKLIKVLVNTKDAVGLDINFSTLDRLLTEKYGSPSFTRNQKKPGRRIGNSFFGGSDLRERAWNLPTTIIRLEYFEARSINARLLRILYKKNLKETREYL